jgi:tetratricopeptide (TPR) repeat protein/tRNA A-37 threonylcarbamoyl transferase component Bud32
MEPARLLEIEAIFHAVLDSDPAEREQFLRERCAEDESLCREVEALLAAHDKTARFIETPLATLENEFFADEDSDRLIGQVIGQYEIVKRIGSGGMGAVYLARRADRQYEQNVAIKLIKRGMDTEAMLRRFRNERQILAGFDHPNIARLLDGNTTADGLPYFVMEYVEGLPIDAYCDAQALDVTRRLQLFRQVCAAVSYAHRHAVIHRDLKPSNILVRSDGVPKLLDFGIARILQSGDAPEAAATMLEQRAITPEYASPEHLRGDPVTTASDVYSLGVVLYRLLTGQRPYGMKGRSAEDMARTVGQTEPQRPSAVVDAPSVRRLRGDLDNIVLMALRQEPERRYATVDQFADDIRRHLEALPVQARADTLAYRAGKFIRRNTAVSVAAALVVLSLVGGIVMTSWQAHRARTQETIAIAEKARAERRFQEVRQLARSVIFDYHDAIENLSGATAVRERLVKDGLAYLDRLASEASGDPELQRELAAAYDRVGDVRGERHSAAHLGDFAGAMDSYVKALRIREALVAAAPGDPQNRRDLAGSYHKIGAQLVDTSEGARGLEYLQKELAILEQLAAEQPGDSDIRQDLGAAYNAHGLAQESLGNLAGALESHRQALAVREALVEADPGNQKLRRSVVISDINLGRALALSGDFHGGLASNHKALVICEALVAENPSSADFRRLLANTWQNDGDYREMLDDVDGALQSFRKKLTLDEQSLTADPLNAVARADISYSYERLAALLAKSGNHAGALSYFRKALAEHEKLDAESSGDLSLKTYAIMARGGIAWMQALLGESAAALAESSRAKELLGGIAADPTSGSLSSLRAQAYMRVAAAYAALGASGEFGAEERREHGRTARELYAESLAVWQDMQRHGTLTADDAAKPSEVTRELARLDQEGTHPFVPSPVP